MYYKKLCDIINTIESPQILNILPKNKIGKVGKFMVNKIEIELAEALAKRCTTLNEVEEVIKTLFKKTIEQMLESEINDHLGYDKNDNLGDNTGNSRNGYNKKTIQSEFGKIEIKIPRDRNGQFEPKVIEKYKKKTENLENRIIEMYAKGMSNRDIETHLKNIYGAEISASLVSRITNKMIPAAREWQTRPLKKTYPIVYFSETLFKIKEYKNVTKKCIYTALGIDTAGLKDILGFWTDKDTDNSDSDDGDKNKYLFWVDILKELKARGLNDIWIASYANLPGFSDAAKDIMPKTAQQPCIIYQINDSTKYVSYKDKSLVLSDLKQIYSAPNLGDAETMLVAFKEKWSSHYPEVSQSWETRWTELTHFFNYSEDVRHMIYTANLAKGFQRILNKFAKSKSVYPSEDALRKAVYLSITEIVKKWTTPISNWESINEQLIYCIKNQFQKDIDNAVTNSN